MASFLSDIDVRIGGIVGFQIYTSANGYSELEEVNQVINSSEGSSFRGTWMLVAQWMEMAQFGSNSSAVKMEVT